MNVRRNHTGDGARRFRTEPILLQHWRALGESLRHFDENRASTAVGIAVMAVALALPALMYVFIENQRTLLDDWGVEPSLTAFLYRDIDLGAAQSLMQDLTEDPRVLRVRLIHRDDAFAEFAAGSGQAYSAAEAANPLPHVLVLVPHGDAWASDRAPGLIASLESNAAVDSVLVDFAWVDRLTKIGALAERVVFVLAVLLAGGALLIVGNTIRVLVHQHAQEIEVLELVGSTDDFIRRPFLYGGALHGLLAGAVAVLLVQAVFAALEAPVARVAESYLSDFAITGISGVQAGLLVAGSCGLGWGGAWIGIALSLRRYDAVD